MNKQISRAVKRTAPKRIINVEIKRSIVHNDDGTNEVIECKVVHTELIEPLKTWARGICNTTGGDAEAINLRQLCRQWFANKRAKHAA